MRVVIKSLSEFYGFTFFLIMRELICFYIESMLHQNAKWSRSYFQHIYSQFSFRAILKPIFSHQWRLCLRPHPFEVVTIEEEGGETLA